MERFWYAISREKLMKNPWSPDFQVQLSTREGHQDISAKISAPTKSAYHDYTLPVHLQPESMEALAGVGSELRRSLLLSAMTMRYGQFER